MIEPTAVILQDGAVSKPRNRRPTQCEASVFSLAGEQWQSTEDSTQVFLCQHDMKMSLETICLLREMVLFGGETMRLFSETVAGRYETDARCRETGYLS